MSIKMLLQTVLVKNKNIGLKLARFSFLWQSKHFIKMTNIVAESGTYEINFMVVFISTKAF